MTDESTRHYYATLAHLQGYGHALQAAGVSPAVLDSWMVEFNLDRAPYARLTHPELVATAAAERGVVAAMSEFNIPRRSVFRCLERFNKRARLVPYLKTPPAPLGDKNLDSAIEFLQASRESPRVQGNAELLNNLNVAMTYMVRTQNILNQPETVTVNGVTHTVIRNGRAVTLIPVEEEQHVHHPGHTPATAASN
jgi:hypothetical protein